MEKVVIYPKCERCESFEKQLNALHREKIDLDLSYNIHRRFSHGEKNDGSQLELEDMGR